jgi:mannose PTS system EIID component
VSAPGVDVTEVPVETIGRRSAGAAADIAATDGTPVPMPSRATWVNIFTRTFAIQGSWNYELLMGTGIGFCVEPALRSLPGGAGGTPYREALARESRYFNAHPYLASVAVGALARAELDRAPGKHIDRFRTALCGPLGSVGDRLIWAGWLPVCSLIALAAYGMGLGPLPVVAIFLGLYNAGHVALRTWGLRAGWTHGLKVAAALRGPVFRSGPVVLARAGAFVAGVALPLALARVIGSGHAAGPIAGVLIAALVGSVLLARMHGRVEGWRVALGVLAGFVLYAMVAPHG